MGYFYIIVTSCSSIAAPINGTLNTTTTIHGTSVLAKCNKGYKFNDNTSEQVLVCLKGTWTDTVQDCEGEYINTV